MPVKAQRATDAQDFTQQPENVHGDVKSMNADIKVGIIGFTRRLFHAYSFFSALTNRFRMFIDNGVAANTILSN